MYAGKTLFAQLMDFVPWTTFTRIVSRYGGDHRVRVLPCAEQYRAMAFAQLTYRESLHDIETCLSVQASKLYHMGLREPVRRSTLADANETRDWRIYADLAQRLIVQARRLYANEDLGLDLTNTVYALDSTTIDLCLSVFPWAHFRTTKAGVKMHTLLDLRGNIPSFIHVSDGKLHDVHALDLLHPPSRHPSGRGVLRDAGQVEHERSPSLFHADGSFDRDHLRPIHRSQRPLHRRALSRTPATRPIQGRRDEQDAGVSDQSLRPSSLDHRRPIQKQVASGTFLQMDQAAPADQAVLRHVGKRREDADMDRRLGLRPRRHRKKAPRLGGVALHIVANFLDRPLRENANISSAYTRHNKIQYFTNN
jgi:Domain of unknown function (DUF4372)/Transposase DDE domain